MLYLIIPGISLSNDQPTESTNTTIEHTVQKNPLLSSNNNEPIKDEKQLIIFNRVINPFIISGLIVCLIMLVSFTALVILHRRKKPENNTTNNQ